MSSAGFHEHAIMHQSSVVPAQTGAVNNEAFNFQFLKPR